MGGRAARAGSERLHDHAPGGAGERRRGSKERFELSYDYPAAGHYTISVRVFSGGCGKRPACSARPRTLVRADRSRRDPVLASAVVSAAPAYRRLDVDERRRRLLELGADLFARHTYAELSMAAIAREAGISKALLYHYFPSKQAYFVATLAQQAQELAGVIAVDPALPPAERLRRALDAFLGWVEENADGYGKLLEGASTHAEVRELVDRVRAATAGQILAGLSPDAPPPPALRAAVHGWLWFMDGALTDWLRHRDMDREQLLGLLLGTLLGAVTASGAPGVAGRLTGSG